MRRVCLSLLLLFLASCVSIEEVSPSDEEAVVFGPWIRGNQDPSHGSTPTGETGDGEPSKAPSEAVERPGEAVPGEAPGDPPDAPSVPEPDVTSPVISVATPVRGQHHQGAGGIWVTGKVVDEAGTVVDFRINGEGVARDSQGNFSHVVTPVHGMNLVVLEATDDAGNSARTVHSVLAAGQFLPGGAEAGPVHESLALDLSPLLFYDPKSPESIASLSGLLAELMTEKLVKSLLPDPVGALSVWPCNQYKVKVKDVDWDFVEPIIVPAPEGLLVSLGVDDVEVKAKLEGSGWLCAFSGSEAKIHAEWVEARTVMVLGLNGKGYPKVELKGVESDVDGLGVDGTNFGGDLIALVANLFSGKLSEMVEDALVELLNGDIGAVVADGLGGLITDIVIPIDIPGAQTGPVTLVLSTDFDALGVDAGGVHARMGAGVAMSHVPALESPGHVARGNCLGSEPEVPPSPSASARLGIREDLVNRVLHGIWEVGTFGFVLTDLKLAEMGVDVSGFGVSGLEVSTYAAAPPLLNGCSGMLSLEWGDLFVHAKLVLLGQPVDVQAYLFVRTAVAVEPSGDGSTLLVKLQPETLVDLDIVAINDHWLGKEASFRQLLIDVLQTALAAAIPVDGLAVELPTLDLDALTEWLSNAPVLGLGVEWFQPVGGSVDLGGKPVFK